MGAALFWFFLFCSVWFHSLNNGCSHKCFKTIWRTLRDFQKAQVVKMFRCTILCKYFSVNFVFTCKMCFRSIKVESVNLPSIIETVTVHVCACWESSSLLYWWWGLEVEYPTRPQQDPTWPDRPGRVWTSIYKICWGSGQVWTHPRDKARWLLFYKDRLFIQT